MRALGSSRTDMADSSNDLTIKLVVRGEGTMTPNPEQPTAKPVTPREG